MLLSEKKAKEYIKTEYAGEDGAWCEDNVIDAFQQGFKAALIWAAENAKARIKEESDIDGNSSISAYVSAVSIINGITVEA